jgi:hypothetical protein
MLTKFAVVPDRANVTVCGQLGVLVTENAEKDGCVSIPTLIVMRLGEGVMKVKVVT